MFSFSLTLYKLLYVFSFKSLRRQKKNPTILFFPMSSQSPDRTPFIFHMLNSNSNYNTMRL